LYENFNLKTGSFAKHYVERSRHRSYSRVLSGPAVGTRMHDEVWYFKLFRPFHLLQKCCLRLFQQYSVRRTEVDQVRIMDDHHYPGSSTLLLELLHFLFSKRIGLPL